MRTERRLHPRYPLAHDATLWLEQGPHPVQTTNLSRGGVQLACDAATLNLLMAQSPRPLQCRLSLDLAEPIELEVRLVVHRRMAEDSYLLGWQFQAYHHDAEQKLDDLLRDLAP